MLHKHMEKVGVYSEKRNDSEEKIANELEIFAVSALSHKNG